MVIQSCPNEHLIQQAHCDSYLKMGLSKNKTSCPQDNMHYLHFIFLRERVPEITFETDVQKIILLAGSQGE